jgi:hypothetical protein
MQPPTFQWMDDNLKRLDRKKPTVLFTHIPVGERVPAIGRSKNGEEMLARFKEFDLRAVLPCRLTCTTARASPACAGGWPGHRR